MRVQWNKHHFSESFTVSNGVRQGSVLSPVLFAIYLDGLLEVLSNSGVGCHWRWLFVGAFCYADDIVLLAPCASASHGLLFNASKTQLICFRNSEALHSDDVIVFNGSVLKFSSCVSYSPWSHLDLQSTR